MKIKIIVFKQNVIRTADKQIILQSHTNIGKDHMRHIFHWENCEKYKLFD